MALILVVDDEVQVRAALRAMLESAGHKVHEAAGGREATVAVLRDRVPDLVITDILMPDHDGIDAILTIRQMYGDLPIIAITGSAFADLDLDTAKAFGATRALVKPIRRDVLLSAVSECLAANPGPESNSPT